MSKNELKNMKYSIKIVAHADNTVDYYAQHKVPLIGWNTFKCITDEICFIDRKFSTYDEAFKFLVNHVKHNNTTTGYKYFTEERLLTGESK